MLYFPASNCYNSSILNLTEVIPMNKIALVCLAAALVLVLVLALTGFDLAPSPAAPETAAPAAATEAVEQAVTAADEAPEAPQTPAEDAFRFTTTDRYGKTWDESCFAGQALTMINFWEPWCPPCVAEMPELERLYEDYAAQGFLILGVYSALNQEADVDAVLADAGTTYPILHYCPEFDGFQTGYVPTTVFVNARGEVVGNTEIGGKDYAAWAKILEDLL